MPGKLFFVSYCVLVFSIKKANTLIEIEIFYDFFSFKKYSSKPKKLGIMLWAKKAPLRISTSKLLLKIQLWVKKKS